MDEKHLEQALVSFLERGKKKFRQQRKIAPSFKNYLKNFKNFKQFRKFVAGSEDPQIKDFYKHLRMDIKDNGSYNKFLNFNNYTIYRNRLLIMVTYYNFFGNIPKRKMTVIVTKGIEGKALKSKRKRSLDKGTQKEYVHKIKVPLNEVTRFIKFKGKMLRMGMTQNFENNYCECYTKESFTLKPKVNPVSPKGTYKGLKRKKKISTLVTPDYDSTMSAVLREYGFLRTYAFKLERHPDIVAFREGKKFEFLKRNKRRRAEKFEDKVGMDWSVLVEYLTRIGGGTFFSDSHSAENKKEMTIAFKILKKKKYATFAEDIVSKNKDDKQNAFDLGTKFLKEFQKAKMTWTSLKSKKVQK